MSIKQEIQYVRGFPFPDFEWFKKQNIEDAMDYVPRDGDFIVASYPKTGTTWLQYIVLQILSKGQYFPSIDDLTFKVAPIMEMAGIQAVEALTPPRFYKHHMPYNLVKVNPNAKTICIYRNPYDTFVSYYHFFNQFKSEKSSDVDAYLTLFLDGKVSCGNYFDHVMSFYRRRNDRNLLMVSYEKLLRSRREEILRIAKFLGEEYFNHLSENGGTLQKIIERTSFEYMKTNLRMIYPSDGTPVDFFRKGTAGDGKVFLNQEQRKRIAENMVQKMDGTDILNEWMQE